MQYEQTTAHMEMPPSIPSYATSSIPAGLPKHPYIPMGNHPYISMGNIDYLSIEVLMRHAI